MKKIPKRLLSLLAALLMLTGAYVLNDPALYNESAPSGHRPNVVFILSDDHTCQAISAYGSKIARTPNIDRLAREGALFRNMFVTNSICGPSRAVLLTGKYSHLNGFRNNGKDVFDSRQQSVAKLMQQGGYQTAWIGKWHLGSKPVGFDYWNVLPDQGSYYNPDFMGEKDTVRHEGYVTELITRFSLDWLNRRQKDKPFMLVIGEKATHRSWLPDLPDLGRYDSTDFPLPETFNDTYTGRLAASRQDMSIEQTMNLAHDLKVHADYQRNGNYNRFTPMQKQAFQAYYEGKVSREYDEKQPKGEALTRWKYQRYMRDYLATAASLDRNIGKILDYLDRSGLAQNTVVIYGSDQGFYLGEHGWFDKRFMYEESFKTPFLVRFPGVVKAGRAMTQLAMNVDWAPTLLDLAGITVPADMQGRSLVPLLTDKATKTPWRDAVFYHYYEYPLPHRVSPHFGIRTERYKLIRFYGASEAWELYDLQKDPHELKNHYGEKGYEQITATLKKKLTEQALQYRDDEAIRLIQTPL